MSARSRAMLLRGVENLLIVGFVAMIAMVFGNVVLRYIFNSGITASEELSRLLFVWLTFGGAFLVAREGGHLGMTTIVLALGPAGRWWCRLAAESLSLLCMVLLVVGCWTQTAINMSNHAPVTGVPLAMTYLAGLVCGLGIGALNLLTIIALLRGQIDNDALVIGAESEELAAFEAQQQRDGRT